MLITQKPVTLTSYNDETLFQSWLVANKAQLSALHGSELRRYGARIVTRTYTCPGCSINAWDAKGKEANVSMKAKASMVGELGEDLDWSERLVDKDWSHYYGQNKGDNVVVFFDGIEVPASTWWWEGLRGRFGKGETTRRRSGDGLSARSHERQSTSSRYPTAVTTDQRQEDYGLLSHDLWGSSMPLRESPVRTRSISRGRRSSSNEDKSPSRAMSTPRRLSRYLEYDQRSTTSRPRTEHGLPPTDPVDNEQYQPTHRTRFLVPEPPGQHPSSTNTSTSSTKTRKPIAHDTEISPPASILRRPLHRKAASLTLQFRSGEDEDASHGWNPL